MDNLMCQFTCGEEYHFLSFLNWCQMVGNIHGNLDKRLQFIWSEVKPMDPNQMKNQEVYE